MRAAIVVAIALLGCASDPRDCSIAAVSGAYTEGAGLDDCGALHSDGYGARDDTLWMAAHDCVLDHVQQQRGFHVDWYSVYVDTNYRGAYVGMIRNGAWTLAAFHEYRVIISPPGPASGGTCSALAAKSPCDTLRDDLCFTCVDEATLERCSP